MVYPRGLRKAPDIHDMSSHSPALAAASSPPASSPLEAARRLAPLVRENADRIDADRELPKLVFHALADARSEEHTSELQSQSNLVCRLLLEKKKIVTTGSRAAADV